MYTKNNMEKDKDKKDKREPNEKSSDGTHALPENIRRMLGMK